MCRGLVNCAVSVVFAACTSSESVDREHCERVRDHLVDLRLVQSQGATDSAGRPVDLEPHRAALKQALGEPFINTCLKEFSLPQVKCLLAAKDSAEATACSSHSGANR